MSMHAISSDEELRNLTARSNVALERTIMQLIRAKAEREDTADIHRKLRLQLSQVLALSSLLGRRRILLQAKDMSRGHKLDAALARSGVGGAFLAAKDVISPFVPVVEFSEAIDDLLKRHPTLAPGYKNVQREYARGHAFALAKSTDEVVTRQVQRVIAQSVKYGSGKYKTSDVVRGLGDWTRGYADTVYETNAASAFSAGVVAQAYDPDVQEVCPAMTILGPTRSPPSRANHVACVGLIAATKDTIWDKYATPLGYRCRHGMNLVDRWKLKEKGLLKADGTVITFKPPNFAAGGPDEGFGTGKLPRRLGLVT